MGTCRTKYSTWRFPAFNRLIIYLHLYLYSPCFSSQFSQEPELETWQYPKSIFDSLKGAPHEIEKGQIWYQKKDLEKLELRRQVSSLSEAHVRRFLQIRRLSATVLHSNLTKSIPNGAARNPGKFIGDSVTMFAEN